MQTLVKKISLQALLFAIITFLVLAFSAAWKSISQLIKKGLSDSSTIRVAEKTSCTVAEQAEPHFTGCNSIL